ncbi:MAG: hypothetical protein HPY85_08285 [Anaerolineae bacterium]|nr:hypothetical protein [Anaerolineae bacterium]
MRQVIFNESINELEVHPPQIYQEFRSASYQSAHALNRQEFTFITQCPACEDDTIHPAFSIDDFPYYECNSCKSIFMNPRPTPKQVHWYTHKSPAAQLRASEEYQQVMQSRLTKLAVYRTMWITSLLMRMAEQRISLVDIEPLGSALVDSLGKKEPIDALMVSPRFITPLTQKTVHRLDDVADGSINVLSAFDILEHQVSPVAFVHQTFKKLAQGGMLIITTRAGSGFDIQVLREYTPTLLPLEHINLLSVEGITALMTNAGYTIEEISTPGQLDVQVVNTYMKNHNNHPIPPSIAYFLEKRDGYAHENLQNFLQTNLLSSHLRAVGSKKELSR